MASAIGANCVFSAISACTAGSSLYFVAKSTSPTGAGSATRGLRSSASRSEKSPAGAATGSAVAPGAAAAGGCAAEGAPGVTGGAAAAGGVTGGADAAGGEPAEESIGPEGVVAIVFPLFSKRYCLTHQGA